MVEHIPGKLMFLVVRLLLISNSKRTRKLTEVSVKNSRDMCDKTSLFNRCLGELEAILQSRSALYWRCPYYHVIKPLSVIRTKENTFYTNTIPALLKSYSTLSVLLSILGIYKYRRNLNMRLSILVHFEGNIQNTDHLKGEITCFNLYKSSSRRMCLENDLK